MYSVDFNGQYPGSGAPGVVDPGFTAGGDAQPYMNSAPTCPANPGAQYIGIVSQNPPGFVVGCRGENHAAAGIDTGYPQYASDVGGIRNTPTVATQNTSIGVPDDSLEITWLHIS